MAQLTIRVGAAVDRSLTEAFRPLIEAANRAKAVVEKTSVSAGAARVRAAKGAVSAEEKEYAKLVKATEKWRRDEVRAAEKAAKDRESAAEKASKREAALFERAAREKARANERAMARALAAARAVALPGTTFGIQIAHAGRKASSQRPWEGARALGPKEDPWQTIGASAIPFSDGYHTPREMAEDDFADVKAAFVAAATDLADDFDRRRKCGGGGRAGRGGLNGAASLHGAERGAAQRGVLGRNRRLDANNQPGPEGQGGGEGGEQRDDVHQR